MVVVAAAAVAMVLQQLVRECYESGGCRVNGRGEARVVTIWGQTGTRTRVGWALYELYMGDVCYPKKVHVSYCLLVMFSGTIAMYVLHIV